MPPESRAAVVREFENGSPANVSTRSRRFRFSLRTLLLAPVLVGATLLCVFPKLVTGDYAELTVTNICVSGAERLRIEMATTISAGTGIGATIPAGGAFGGLVLEGGTEGSIPTWPQQGRTVISLRLCGGDAPQTADGNSESLLAVKVGETYCVMPGAPLKLEATQVGFGGRGKCMLQVWRGYRLGIKL